MFLIDGRKEVMSEYHLVDIGLADGKCIVKALEEMGYKPQVHKDAVQLHGYRGDKRTQKAHIVLPKSQVGSASNDIGFEKVDGEYVLHVSEFDKGQKRLDNKKLKQLYAKHRIETVVSKKAGKYKLKSTKVDKEGRIRIKLGMR